MDLHYGFAVRGNGISRPLLGHHAPFGDRFNRINAARSTSQNLADGASPNSDAVVSE